MCSLVCWWLLFFILVKTASSIYQAPPPIQKKINIKGCFKLICTVETKSNIHPRKLFKLLQHFHIEHNLKHGHRGKTSCSKQQVPTAAKAKQWSIKLRFSFLHWCYSEYFHLKLADKTKCDSSVKNTLDPLELLRKRHLPLLKCIQWSIPNRASLLLCRVRPLFPLERSAALSQAASQAIALELNWTNMLASTMWVQWDSGFNGRCVTPTILPWMELLTWPQEVACMENTRSFKY